MPGVMIQRALEWALHQGHAARLHKAKQLYRQVRTQQPHHARALDCRTAIDVTVDFVYSYKNYKNSILLKLVPA